MHREADGFGAAYQLHGRRGSVVIYMLMVLAEAMRTGQGAERRCQQREGRKRRRRKRAGAGNRIQPLGVENHLLLLSSAGPAG